MRPGATPRGLGDVRVRSSLRSLAPSETYCISLLIVALLSVVGCMSD